MYMASSNEWRPSGGTHWGWAPVPWKNVATMGSSRIAAVTQPGHDRRATCFGSSGKARSATSWDATTNPTRGWQ